MISAVFFSMYYTIRQFQSQIYLLLVALQICDLPFAFFSDPSLMPVLVGTLLAICYGSEQNRDVIQEEISMEMLLSLLKTSRKEMNNDVSIEGQVCSSIDEGPQIDAAANDEKPESRVVEGIILTREEMKRMIDDPAGSDSETNYNLRQQAVSRLGLGKTSNAADSPGRKGSKTVIKTSTTADGEQSSAREVSIARSSINKNQVKGSALSTSVDTATQLLRKAKVPTVESSMKISNPNTGLILNKRQSVTCDNTVANSDCLAMSTDVAESNAYLRSDLLLGNRFPACLLDKAQAFFSSVL